MQAVRPCSTHMHVTALLSHHGTYEARSPSPHACRGCHGAVYEVGDACIRPREDGGPPTSPAARLCQAAAWRMRPSNDRRCDDITCDAAAGALRRGVIERMQLQHKHGAAGRVSARSSRSSGHTGMCHPPARPRMSGTSSAH